MQDISNIEDDKCFALKELYKTGGYNNNIQIAF